MIPFAGGLDELDRIAPAAWISHHGRYACDESVKGSILHQVSTRRDARGHNKRTSSKTSPGNQNGREFEIHRHIICPRKQCLLHAS